MTAHERPLRRGIEIGNRRSASLSGQSRHCYSNEPDNSCWSRGRAHFSSKIERQFAAFRRASAFCALVVANGSLRQKLSRPEHLDSTTHSNRAVSV